MIVMRRLLITFLAIFLCGLNSPQANAAYLADCIVATNANFKDSGFEKVYEVTLKNACGDAFKESLNYTGLSFYADYYTVNPEQDSIFYLQSYGSTYTFKLRNLKSGTYRPYLKIFVPKDYSNKTINLPGFTIANPLECVAYVTDRFTSDIYSKTLIVTLKNNCLSLSGRNFSILQLQLEVPGYYGYISSKTIFSLESYGTDFQFELPEIKAGSYYPTLTVKDSSFNSKRIPLSTIRIMASPTPTPSASKTSSKISPVGTAKLCSTAKKFDDQCADFPNFKFQLCSSLQNGQLQEKVGSVWSNLWKVKGIRDSISCPSRTNPFLVTVSGTNSTKIDTSLRIVFTKTAKLSSYTQYFKVENR